MSTNSISSELQVSLLGFYQHCEDVLASHRTVEATGNLAVGGVTLHVGQIAPQDESVSAKRVAGKQTMALRREIGTTVEGTLEVLDLSVKTDAEFRYRHLARPAQTEDYVQSVALQLPGALTTVLVTERLAGDDRETLLVLVEEDQLAIASLTRVPKATEAFVRQWTEVFGDNYSISELLTWTGGFEELYGRMQGISYDIDIELPGAVSPTERRVMRRLLRQVPDHILRNRPVARLTPTVIEDLTIFVDSLAASR